MSTGMLKNMSNVSRVVLIVALLALPPLLQMVGYNYGILIINFALLYIVAVSGLDVVFGYSGQISLGHAAYFAIGAYGSVMLNTYLNVPVFFAMIISAVSAMLIGIVIAYPATRLKFHFLALATIAFGEIVFQLVAQSPNKVTGNFLGLHTVPISLFGFELDTYIRFYYYALIVVVLLLIVKSRIIDSKTGRAMIAIRENAHAADGMGINVTRFKVIAFAVSAFYTGYAGGMYAHLTKYISPDTFVYKQSVMFLTMLLFGGTGSFWGPIVGVVSVTLLNEGLRSAERYQMFIYGALMLIVILVLPGGIYGKFKEIVQRIKTKRDSQPKSEQEA